MITVNSLSGGKSSSYMAYHYPADYNVFSLVQINDSQCSPKDKSLIQKVSDKIGKEFIATAEDDITLYAMLDLEQLIGKEILWLTGLSFDDLIIKKKALPNQAWRFCTTEMKLRPIWDWWYKNIKEKIRMGIGFRYDELERAERLSTSFKGITGKRGTRNKWETIEWREGYFPMIEDGIFPIDVVNWSKDIGLNFPADSNCIGCFHKSPQQLRKNYESNPDKFNWFQEQENKMDNTFKKEIGFKKIRKMGIQSDFLFGEGSGCQSGFCTD